MLFGICLQSHDMKVPRGISRVGLLLVACLCFVSPQYAYAVSGGESLRIRELNITGEEFVVLQNAGTTDISLENYWLGYISDDAATYVVPSQQLPSAVLEPGQAALLNNGPASACDAVIVDQLGFSSLSNTKGTLQLRRLTNTPTSSTFTTVDSVSWGKLADDAIQIASETELDDAATKVWYQDTADATSLWRVGSLAGCTLTLAPVATDPTSPPEMVIWEQANTSPPAVFVGSVLTNSNSKNPGIPASDKGLKSPQLSEILPNPASPQTDAANEFIELYNPNTKPFDLSGFMLQTGSTTSSTTHVYHFPAGTKLGPNSFKAFSSAQTHLTLNNNGGQIWLIDPLGTVLDKSDVYGTAKDGQAWVDAAAKWQWTAVPTPGSTNKVATPLASSAGSKTATVNNKVVTKVGANSPANTLGATTVAETNQASPLTIHPLTLAVIIMCALLYGAYEYRHDLALKYQQFRRNRNARR